jgi:hypothetical protein
MRIPLRHCDMTGVALAHSRGGDGADHKFNCAHRSQGSDATGVALTQSGRRKRWPKPERCAYGSQGTATCQARHLRTVGGAMAVAETVSGCIPLRHSDMTGVALANSRGSDGAGHKLNCAPTTCQAWHLRTVGEATAAVAEARHVRIPVAWCTPTRQAWHLRTAGESMTLAEVVTLRMLFHTPTWQARHLRKVRGDGGARNHSTVRIRFSGHCDVTGVALAHSRGRDSGGRSSKRAHTVHRALRRARRGTCAQSEERRRWPKLLAGAYPSGTPT